MVGERFSTYISFMLLAQQIIHTEQLERHKFSSSRMAELVWSISEQNESIIRAVFLFDISRVPSSFSSLALAGPYRPQDDSHGCGIESS